MSLPRLLALGGLTALLVAVLASVPARPALAHGGDTPDASNYTSVIGGVVRAGADGSVTSQQVDVDGVRWRVLGNDALLEVANHSGSELVVPGYEGEPYLRIGPEGAWENRNSPAAYLNNDRYAQTVVPPGVSADAEPDWVRVADEPVHRWHDHRIHWMAPTLPPQVATDATRAVVVQDWTVPFSVDGRALAVTGELHWVPPPPWWPWPAAALVVTGIPVLAALAAGRGEQRRTLVPRTAAAVLAVVALVDVVHMVDDVVAMPATLAEHAVEVGQSALFVAVALAAAVRAWRGGDATAVALALGALSLFVGVGLTHLPSLRSSQLVTELPPAFTRAVVAANLAAVVPVGLAAWWVRPEAPAGEAGGEDSGTTAAEVPG